MQKNKIQQHVRLLCGQRAVELVGCYGVSSVYVSWLWFSTTPLKLYEKHVHVWICFFYFFFPMGESLDIRFLNWFMTFKKKISDAHCVFTVESSSLLTVLSKEQVSKYLLDKWMLSSCVNMSSGFPGILSFVQRKHCLLCLVSCNAYQM